MDQLDERACASAWVIAALLASSLLSPAVVQPAGAPVPEHATPVPYGAGWKCNRGYRQAGTVCLPVEVPENASLNALGNGWRCNRGFFEQGGRCSEVIVPPNATLNSLGNGWICARGFVRENNRKRPVTTV